MNDYYYFITYCTFNGPKINVGSGRDQVGIKKNICYANYIDFLNLFSYYGFLD